MGYPLHPATSCPWTSRRWSPLRLGDRRKDAFWDDALLAKARPTRVLHVASRRSAARRAAVTSRVGSDTQVGVTTSEPLLRL